MPDHIRCYMVFDGGAPRTPEQWSLLKSGLCDKPMAAGVIAAARAEHNQININRPSNADVDGKYRYLLGDFEIDGTQVDLLLILLNSRVAFYGISPGLSNKEKFRQVILAEMREVAVEAGYPGVASLLDLTITGFGARETAIMQNRTWVAARVSDWQVEI